MLQIAGDHASCTRGACAGLPAPSPTMLSIPMRGASACLLAALILQLPGPGNALARPGEIERVASKADQGVRAIVKRLSGAAFGGRDNNTPESDKAQAFLVNKLRRLGAGLNSAAVGDDAYRQPFTQSGQTGTNLLAVIRGRELPDEYVVVGGHYDHLDSRSNASGHCSRNTPPGGEICPGATDNAAGSGVVLGIGRALRKLSQPPRRSVVLALWDAEEDGLRDRRRDRGQRAGRVRRRGS